LSVRQAAGWAEESGKAWGTIFNHTLRGWTDFFATDDILPVPASVPEFTTYLEGKIDGTMLRAPGTARWHVHMSSAGLLNPITTTCSDCILGVITTSVTLTNSYTLNLEQIPPVLDTHAAISLFPSTFSDVSLSRVVSRESNYLGLLTLAWTYVLSAYWSEVQQGVLRYTDCKAPCCPSTTTASSTHPCDIFLTLDASEADSAEVEWWRAILAPGKGWEASIDAMADHGRHLGALTMAMEIPLLSSYGKIAWSPVTKHRTTEILSACYVDSPQAVVFFVKPAWLSLPLSSCPHTISGVSQFSSLQCFLALSGKAAKSLKSTLTTLISWFTFYRALLPLACSALRVLFDRRSITILFTLSPAGNGSNLL
jgi:hypothetical protein